jgi:hypothetical protein
MTPAESARRILGILSEKGFLANEESGAVQGARTMEFARSSGDKILSAGEEITR